ncbi:hypothetical protein [Paenibacillus agricola]|uniref:TniQ protein n=1 Tax=Paenibacillus agricola TaxID=2716264 RepID=A0ABX0JK72_9BACL|nr:hypothetical protein [Paenibacillus agricola]NHN34989.1 hypothetical protein [Paenibacillus agricola]
MGNNEVKTIKNSKIGQSRRELIQLSGFNQLVLQQYLECDLVEHNSSTISKILKPIENLNERVDTWFPLNLKWCEQCIKHGYHSWLHQFTLIQHCPFHYKRLNDTCPRCYKNIPFLLSDEILGDPFTCQCGFQLAAFSETQWKDWALPNEILDPSVINWLETGGEGVKDSTHLLFNPRSTSLHMFTQEPLITYRTLGKNTTSINRWSDEILQEISIINKNCFRAVDRYIKKKIVFKHRKCIQILQELLKKEDDPEFPRICPYAYAYVFWKHTLLKTDHFYSSSMKGSDMIQPKGMDLVTKLMEPHILYLKERLYRQKCFTEISDRRLFHWIISRYTIELCLKFFYNWLSIAKQSSEDKRVPTWNEVNKMADESLPKIIFKHQKDDGITEQIAVILNEQGLLRLLTNKDMKCETNPKRMKKEYRLLKSYTPLSIAMNEQTVENKQLGDYVGA